MWVPMPQATSVSVEITTFVHPPQPDGRRITDVGANAASDHRLDPHGSIHVHHRVSRNSRVVSFLQAVVALLVWVQMLHATTVSVMTL